MVSIKIFATAKVNQLARISMEKIDKQMVKLLVQRSLIF